MNRILLDTPIPSPQRTEAAPLEQPAAHTGMYVTGFLLAASFFVVAAAHWNCPQRASERERERENKGGAIKRDRERGGGREKERRRDRERERG